MLQEGLFRECMLGTWDQKILSKRAGFANRPAPIFYCAYAARIFSGGVEGLFKHNGCFSPAKTGFEEAADDEATDQPEMIYIEEGFVS